MTLKVIDLFCGPGGFSTGFELAGFQVIAGYDFNKNAIATFSKNHSGEGHLVDLSNFDYSVLPEADIIIGGPPCTQFSTSKSNKTRNVLDGLILVQSFLRCVHERKPKYWIMENVPAIQNYLPKTIPLEFIGVKEKGNLEIPTKVELIASNFGVPQSRKRYFIGNFPVPSPSHKGPSQNELFSANDLSNWVTMGEILSEMPSPLTQPKQRIVTDPNYGISITEQNLTDHFYDTTLSEIEKISIKNSKQEHPYMGRMAWPDRLDKPARTVVATQLGRETLIIEDKGTTEYRRATIRECATFQSFPYTYQFFGPSYSAKYKQAGDAVPPLLSFALASSILLKEKYRTIKPKVRGTITEPANLINSDQFTRKRKPSFTRKASFLVPAKEVRGARCELFVSEHSKKPAKVGEYEFCSPIWSVKLTLGEGKGNTSEYRINSSIKKYIADLIKSDDRTNNQFASFLSSWLKLKQNYQNSNSIYASYVLEQSKFSPLKMLEEIKELSNIHFPREDFHQIHFDCSHLFNHKKSSNIKVRVLLGAYIAFDLIEHWKS